MKKILTLVLSVGSLYSLLFFSGCTDILGINTSYSTFCDSEIAFDGPSSLFVDPCDPLDITYNVLFNGSNITDPGNTVEWGFVWIVEGDLEVISAPSKGPLVVRPFSNGKGGQITLMGQVDGDCEAEGDSNKRTLVTLGVSITPSELSIDLHLCKDQMGQVLSGSATVIDTELPLTQDYIWQVNPPGAASISPTTGPNISITNVIADFELALQKLGKKCTTTPILKPIPLKDIPICN